MEVQNASPEKKSVWSNVKTIYKVKPLYKNVLILASIWSTASFTFYFVEFYTKFVPTQNIYLLNCIIGFADICSNILFIFCVSRMELKVVLLSSYGMLCIASFGLFMAVEITDMADFDPAVDEISTALNYTFAALVFLVRAGASIGFSMAYYGNVALSPPVLLSSVYALTNIACRFCTTFSPLIADIIENPSIVVTVLSTITFVSSIFIKENTRMIELPPESPKT